MTARPAIVTATDVALLQSVATERSIAAAARALHLPRDRAMYRLRRLAVAFDGPIVSANRGGRDHGQTILTPLGDRILRGGASAVEIFEGRPVTNFERPNLLHGIYHRSPSPAVDVGGPRPLRVTFDGTEGEPVGILLDPEAVLLARSEFLSSARNVLYGNVTEIDRAGRSPVFAIQIQVRWGPWRLKVAVTPEVTRALGLRRGSPVLLYVKATALRRAAGLGFPRPPTVTPGSLRRSVKKRPRPREGSASR